MELGPKHNRGLLRPRHDLCHCPLDVPKGDFPGASSPLQTVTFEALHKGFSKGL